MSLLYPEPVMVDILSRLPVKTIVHCKCVCKKWLKIVLDSYFADLQLSRSPAGFMIYHNPKSDEKLTFYRKPGILNWVEVEDEPDHHNLHHDPVMSLDLNLVPTLQESQILLVGSVNGLICLRQCRRQSDNTYICNPITREYLILPSLQYYRRGFENIVYCFGVSLLTREYKVIRIFQRDMPPGSTSTFQLCLSEAEVYSLGTGQWRSLGHVPYWLRGFYGPFLYGHAHWTIGEQDSCEKICAFNFDNETFELFPSPPSEAIEESHMCLKRLGVSKGCLSRCDTYNFKLTVWVMKEYGIKKSWHKELVIQQSISHDIDRTFLECLYIIEGLKDGTILMGSYGNKLVIYCPRRKTIVDTKMFDYYVNGLAYRPSFHRLCNFGNERVHVL